MTPDCKTFIQATPNGQRLLICEIDIDTAQANGAWISAHHPVEVRP